MGAFLKKLKRWITNTNTVRFPGSRCPACGSLLVLVGGPAIWPELSEEWGLQPEWWQYFNEREGLKCVCCRSNLRAQHLARGIMKVSAECAKTSARSLKELGRDPAFHALKVAEMNAAGRLHPFLAQHPSLYYSEFGSTDVPSEDLTALTYEDGLFDIAITSETLEHVPNIEAALSEIYRVLKPGGVHVFSAPVVWDGRKTRKRASIERGVVIHHHPPSYHGLAGQGASDLLVFYEFGEDLVEMCRANGFEVESMADPSNKALVTLMAWKR
jgi:SAM-dependent methyltransferase